MKFICSFAIVLTAILGGEWIMVSVAGRSAFRGISFIRPGRQSSLSIAREKLALLTRQSGTGILRQRPVSVKPVIVMSGVPGMDVMNATVFNSTEIDMAMQNMTQRLRIHKNKGLVSRLAAWAGYGESSEE